MATWDGPFERASLARATPFGRKSMVPLTDEERLVARAATGDDAAFRALYERHRVDVARLAYRMLGPCSDLDDVVQEVFVQVYRSLRDFRRQSKLSTWLHRVTVNVVLMHRRSARSRPALTHDPVADATAASDARPDEDAERRERVRAFARLLAKCPKRTNCVRPSRARRPVSERDRRHRRRAGADHFELAFFTRGASSSSCRP